MRSREYYENMCEIMIKTRGSRFTAAESLRTKDLLSVSSVAFLSIYMLGWAIASFSYPELFSDDHGRFFNAVSAVASAALLVISLMDFGLGRAVAAERLQNNALQITVLLRKMERALEASTPNTQALDRICSEYETLNLNTQINHGERDYKLWKYKAARSKSILINSTYRVRSALYTTWFFTTSMIAQITLVAIILASTLYYTVKILFT